MALLSDETDLERYGHHIGESARVALPPAAKRPGRGIISVKGVVITGYDECAECKAEQSIWLFGGRDGIARCMHRRGY